MYNIVLVSYVLQSEWCICVYITYICGYIFFRFLSIIGYYKMLYVLYKNPCYLFYSI